MSMGSNVDMGSKWVHRGYRVHYGYVFYHEWICNLLNILSAN